MECSICLQRFVNPVQLLCGHTFCFLCVKGAANVNKRCAICRQEIPENYFEKPILVDVNCIEAPVFDNDYQWFYEGRNGWWLYDKRTGEELEQAYKGGNKRCELLIAGFLYVIDFEASMQYRRNEPHRKRRIKRDRSDSGCTKGVAGIRISSTVTQSVNTEVPDTSDVEKDVPSCSKNCDTQTTSTETRSELDNSDGNRTEISVDELSSRLSRELNLNKNRYRETYL